jgi:hypothetical protein
MTNENLTQLLVVTDRSGSMATCAGDMIGGLNTFFDEQAKLDGECVVDYVQFDNEYEVVFTDKPVSEARAQLVPRGSTALLDAIGKAVTDLGKKLADKPEDERPGTVIVVTITDGYENSSREWTAETVKELIKNQEDKYNWNFTFLGANMDAVAVGRQFGFNPDTSLTFDTTNVAAASASLSGYATNTRSHLPNAYTDEDRESQGV